MGTLLCVICLCIELTSPYHPQQSAPTEQRLEQVTLKASSPYDYDFVTVNLRQATTHATPAAQSTSSRPTQTHSVATTPNRAGVRKKTDLKTGDGRVLGIELVNSNSRAAFECLLGSNPAGAAEKGTTVWRLRLAGRPGWSTNTITVRDEGGREFKRFCSSQDKNVGGLFLTTLVLEGPRDARKLTLALSDSVVHLEIPELGSGPGQVTPVYDHEDYDKRFDAAFKLKDKGRYGEALRLFKDNIRRYAFSDHIDYDHGWGAYCAARAGRFAEAAELYWVTRLFFYGDVETFSSKYNVLQRRNWDNKLTEVKKVLGVSASPNAKAAMAKIRQLEQETSATSPATDSSSSISTQPPGGPASEMLVITGRVLAGTRPLGGKVIIVSPIDAKTGEAPTRYVPSGGALVSINPQARTDSGGNFRIVVPRSLFEPTPGCAVGCEEYKKDECSLGVYDDGGGGRYSTSFQPIIVRFTASDRSVALRSVQVRRMR